MKKGIIMDMDDVFLTLLTPDGEFLRARKQEHPYVIGEEIQFSPVELRKPFVFYLWRKDFLKQKPVWAISIAAALLIFLGSLLPMYQETQAYAYMSIDGSSSIELGINKKIEVVELTGFNKEGKNVVSHISNWKNKEAFQIAKTIFAEMQKQGLLNKDNHVIISTVLPIQQETSVEKKLKENLDEIKQAAEKDQLKVSLVQATESDREKAQEEGLTTGKYEEDQKDSIIQPDTENQKLNQDTQKQETPIPEGQQQAMHNPSLNPSLPPGQLKKQEKTAVPNVHNSAQNQGEINSGNQHKGTNKVPPGLEKKKQQGQGKVNFGQYKKNEFFNQFDIGNGISNKDPVSKKQGIEGKGNKE